MINHNELKKDQIISYTHRKHNLVGKILSVSNKVEKDHKGDSYRIINVECIEDNLNKFLGKKHYFCSVFNNIKIIGKGK